MREVHPELLQFLEPFDRRLTDLYLSVRRIIISRFPGINELIYDSYNTVSTAFSISDKLDDAFCHLAIYSRHLNLGFNRGNELQDSQAKLEGKGKKIRHLTIRSTDDLDLEMLQPLLDEAFSLSRRDLDPKKPVVRKRSVVKSVAARKRR